MEGRSSTFLIVASLLFAGAQAIINGTYVADDSPLYKSMVSLQRNGEHKCGGVLLDGKTVLTAAHCYHIVFLRTDGNLVPYRSITAVMGTNRLSSPSAKRVAVCQTVFWPEDLPEEAKTWQLFRMMYREVPDYVIMILAEVVPETEDIKYATLPSSTEQVPKDGERCDLVGYGRHKHPDIEPEADEDVVTFFHDPSDRLKRAQLEVDDDLSCYGSIGNSTEGDDSIYCAKPLFRDGESLGMACVGDSGSPIFCTNDEQVGYYAGHSIGGEIPCNVPDGFMVFHRAFSKKSWIESFLRNGTPATGL